MAAEWLALSGAWAEFCYYAPADINYQLFLLLSLMAMAGSSAFSLSIYLPAYFAFVPTMLLPMFIQLLLIGDSLHFILAAVTLTFFAAMTLFNLKINHNFKLNYALRFENTDLIEKLRQQKAEADYANQAKSDFLAAANHDLRQPLYALNLYATLLNESEINPKSKGFADRIQISVNALRDMLDSLLDMSQLDAGAMTAQKRNFSLDTLLQKLINDFTPQAQEKGLEIHWPNCNQSVYSDPTLLEQILRNYIANAIRHTHSGSVTVICNQQDGMLKLSVIDTGPGIPEQSHLQRVSPA